MISVLTSFLKDFHCFFADLKPPEARAGTLGEGCDGGRGPSPPLSSQTYRIPFRRLSDDCLARFSRRRQAQGPLGEGCEEGGGTLAFYDLR